MYLLEFAFLFFAASLKSLPSARKSKQDSCKPELPELPQFFVRFRDNKYTRQLQKIRHSPLLHNILSVKAITEKHKIYFVISHNRWELNFLVFKFAFVIPAVRNTFHCPFMPNFLQLNH